jgi:acetyltransferase
MKSILENYFYPESIAVIGASSKPKSIGYEILSSIKQYNYSGSVYPVNPKSDMILGYKCFDSISSIKDKIDLALVVVPKQFVENSIDELINKGVKSILLVTAGFKEVGSEGEKLEKKIVSKIKAQGMHLVGPNCMGVINTQEDICLNATFVAEKPAAGTLAFLSQSGALGAAVLNSLRVSDIKFAHFISVGNKADLNENDFVDYWESDENIKIIAAYLESFDDGLGFLKPFMLSGRSKPCIILKAGRTESGRQAASSHTGAISSEDDVIDSLLRQFGIIRTADLNELFNTAKGFEDFPMPAGDRIAVVTNAGGPAILAVDEIENRKLSLAGFSDRTISELSKIVNPEGSINNPVDLLPGATPEMYKRVNEIVLEDDNVDALISIFVEPVMVDAFEVVESVNQIESGKPLIQVAMPLPEFWDKYRTNSNTGRTLFRNPEDPARVLSDMLFYQRTRDKLKKDTDEYSKLISLNKERLEAEPGLLPHDKIETLLYKYDLPVVNSHYIKPDDIDNAKIEAYPVVIKGLSKSVIHKTDLNGVIVNIKNRDELLSAAESIKSNFTNAGSDVEYFQIQPFITAKHEILIGGYRDSSFGPVLVFGTGGKYVEVYNDSAIVSAYASDRDLEELILSTKMGEILKGTRGDKPVDLKKIIRILINCSRMMIEKKNISEFDFNPLLVNNENELFIVDVRINVE